MLDVHFSVYSLRLIEVGEHCTPGRIDGLRHHKWVFSGVIVLSSVYPHE